MRIRGLLAVFFILTLLFTGCSGDDTKSKSGRAGSRQKAAPTKPAKPSEGS